MTALTASDPFRTSADLFETAAEFFKAWAKQAKFPMPVKTIRDVMKGGPVLKSI